MDCNAGLTSDISRPKLDFLGHTELITLGLVIVLGRMSGRSIFQRPSLIGHPLRTLLELHDRPLALTFGLYMAGAYAMWCRPMGFWPQYVPEHNTYRPTCKSWHCLHALKTIQ